MTWTYTGDPVNVRLDEIRMLVGDVVEDDQIMSDEELQWFMDKVSTSYGCAHAVAQACVAKFARLMSNSIGDLRAEFSQKFEHYRTLSRDLAQMQHLDGHTPRYLNEKGTDFVRGQMDFPIGRVETAYWDETW